MQKSADLWFERVGTQTEAAEIAFDDRAAAMTAQGYHARRDSAGILSK